MSRENSDIPNQPSKIDGMESLDEVIAWCLLKRDAGEFLDQESIIATFPTYEDELRAFFLTEQVFDHITAQPLRLPQTVAHYEIGEMLGRGSFGEVRRAWDQRLHRSVAIKFPRFLTDEKSLERFMREARTTSQLSHPSIVTTHEIGEHENTPYIVAEYVEGIPLEKWGERPLDADIAVDLVQKIADAIGHAHGLGVIHRDLNPRNILIDFEGQPKILDFGLAKCLDDLGTVTIHGDVLGTPAYVSPEQIGGGHNVDGRTDIYAIGSILYELITGKRPFDGDLRLLLHRIQFERPANPKLINPRIPIGLAEICLKCLEKNPELRFESAEALGLALREVQPANSLELRHRYSLRRRVGLVAALTGVCILSLSLMNGQRLESDDSNYVPAAGSELNLTETQGDETQIVTVDGPAPTVQKGVYTVSAHAIWKSHTDTVSSLEFSSDGSRLITCSFDNTVRAWDWETREKLWVNRDHSDKIWSITVSPDDQTIGTAGWDRMAYLLDADTGKQRLALEGHSDRICNIQIERDRAITASLDGSVRFWNPDTGEQIGALKRVGWEVINSIPLDGQRMLTADWKGYLTYWQLDDERRLFHRRSNSAAIWSVNLSPDGTKIVTGGEDGCIGVWDFNGQILAERRMQDLPSGNVNQVTCVRFHPDGKRIISSSHDGIIRVWEPTLVRVESQYIGHEHWIYEFKIHPSGEKLVSVSADQTIRIWDWPPQE